MPDDEPGLLDEGGRLDPATFPDWVVTASVRGANVPVWKHLVVTVGVWTVLGLASVAVCGAMLILLMMLVRFAKFFLVAIAGVVVLAIVGVVSAAIVGRLLYELE